VTVVVDANILVALVLPLPYSDVAFEKFSSWKKAEESILSPTLMEYEVITALRRASFQGLLTGEQAQAAINRVLQLNVQCIPPTKHLHQQALRWAARLGQARAYDAQYLAVAEERSLTLWTGDRRLANTAQQLNLSWVRWVGEGSEH
jgi:predicted nucleic acid-binding protein